MTTRALLIALLASAGAFLAPPVAVADEVSVGCPNPIRVVEVVLEQGRSVERVRLVCPGTTQAASGSDGGGVVQPSTGTGLCVGYAWLVGIDAGDYCYDDTQEAPTVTGEIVLEAFRSSPLPPATLQVQPPNGRTLVNFDTNFFTVREPFTRTVTLLGQAVELRITPAQFTWRFGDGTDTTTTTPGAAYPDLQVTHDYQRTGDYAPSVDTTYSAEWRLAGGAWQPVPGTVTIAGESVALTAVEAQPTLVSYG